jgi:tetratricopeptide (TPR) repeat protein
MSPISAEFRPGDRFFDHYDLVALEHRDFYPDGRDLGENYTYTAWMLSPCVKSGQLDCVHCHTSSGRYRFAGEKTNEACLPCHREKVADPAAHSRHRAGTPGAECVSCHMPMTSFARMRRSDHSMRPPAPAASIEFGSPNACNLCHADKDAAWADRTVRQWRSRDYQTPILRQARLVDAARKRDWSRLDEILDYLRSPGRDEIYAASLARLLRQCEDGRKWPVLLGLLKDPSPLVRASAADALAGGAGPEVIAALAEAAADGFRLVRIRAAAVLAAVPEEYLDPGQREAVRRATTELIASLKTRPDDAGSHASLGNFHFSRREADRAIASFETALRLQPDGVATLVNASLAYNIAGRNDRAEEHLRRALQIEPGNAAAHFNLGLLLGEMGRPAEAKAELEAALRADPQMAAAAFNLCVLAGEANLGEALRYCALAVRLRPGERRYAEALAYYEARARR